MKEIWQNISWLIETSGFSWDNPADNSEFTSCFLSLVKMSIKRPISTGHQFYLAENLLGRTSSDRHPFLLQRYSVVYNNKECIDIQQVGSGQRCIVHYLKTW